MTVGVLGAISADAGIPVVASQQAGAEPVQSRGLGSLTSRILSGSVLGLAGGLIILAGGWVFTVATCLVAYQATQEFYGFITSKGISAGMEPPPPAVSVLTSLMCVCLSVWTYASHGRSTAALAVSAFALLSLQLLTVKQLRFSQLASSVFGLFYCGYLPSFWIKLRVLSAPAINSTAVHGWPVLFGGITHWTVGLIATFMTVACTIAADTGAYAFGRTLGRTQLISISPKKTVEGAIGGLACSTVVALAFWRFLRWPAQVGVAVGLALLIFLASLCGDLIESVMKREAGLKDSSDLIPGHGGLLDRFDSYIFTGAIVYFVLKFVTPLFGL
ncbi:g913 [Coccomyxa viridis]|uniref:Phosphatidate cytidylyltransferase n=1 Tax=Coccomyxa viridis TaxID=1274662 RepID=A0ABP1FNM7_9CHLO